MCGSGSGVQLNRGRLLKTMSRDVVRGPGTRLLVAVAVVAVIAGKLSLDLSDPAAAPDLVVEESENGKSEADAEDDDIDGEAAAVLGLVIRSEDLGTVDTGDVCTHDDPIIVLVNGFERHDR